jgi:biopolymer transport protein ExbB
MKKLIAIVALLGILMVQTSNVVMAQDAAGTEEVAAEGDGGITLIKRYFIEGDYVFMSLPLLCLILGLAFCIERIITLSLADVNTKKLLTGVQSAIGNKDVEKAKQICKATRGPVASIMYQGLTRTDEGIDIVEKSVASYGSVQMGQLEKGLSWISLFIALAPMLGFLGTVIGMVQAFDDIANAGAISATIVASGIKVALLTTVFGLIVAIILQIFYNFIVTKVESIVNKMEDNSISFIDILVKNKIV